MSAESTATHDLLAASRRTVAAQRAAVDALRTKALQRGYFPPEALPHRANEHYARFTIFGPSFDFWDGRQWWRCSNLGNNKRLPRLPSANQSMPWRELRASERRA